MVEKLSYMMSLDRPLHQETLKRVGSLSAETAQVGNLGRSVRARTTLFGPDTIEITARDGSKTVEYVFPSAIYN